MPLSVCHSGQNISNRVVTYKAVFIQRLNVLGKFIRKVGISWHRIISVNIQPHQFEVFHFNFRKYWLNYIVLNVMLCSTA